MFRMQPASLCIATSIIEMASARTAGDSRPGRLDATCDAYGGLIETPCTPSTT